jgi:O-antigen/teichoic acid export membrane protein
MKIVLNKGETEHKTISILGSVTSALTVLFYILFSVIKRFGQNDVLFWIPFILFIVNLLILLKMLYTVFFRDYLIKKNSLIWLVIRSALNFFAVILVGSYLK